MLTVRRDLICSVANDGYGQCGRDCKIRRIEDKEKENFFKVKENAKRNFFTTTRKRLKSKKKLRKKNNNIVITRRNVKVSIDYLTLARN